MEDDPDETEGRRLYRARADSLAKAQASIASKKVKYIKQSVIQEKDEDHDISSLSYMRSET